MRLWRQASHREPFVSIESLPSCGREARAFISILRVFVAGIATLLWAVWQAHCIAPVAASPTGLSVESAAQRSVTQIVCSTPLDPIYAIGPRSFTPYRCRSATDCPLRLIESPPAPQGWNQPQFPADSTWLDGSPVWWNVWNQPGWRPLSFGCGQPIGLQDAGGRAVGANGTTQLYRRVIELEPPQPGMRIRAALLEMWSDNKSAWWWQGELIASDRQGYVGQIDLAPDHIAPLGGSYVLAIQNSNDFVCSESDYCNPQGTLFRLSVTWAPARTFAYLPLIVKPCRYSTLLTEEFDDLDTFTSTHPRHLRIEPLLSRAVLAVRRSETRYLWRSIPDLPSADFRLTVTGSITSSDNNCGLAVALRHGAPVLTQGAVAPESRIISQSNPGVLIGFSYCGADCGNALQNHVHAESIGVDGQWAGTHEGCLCNYTAGSVIPIQQSQRYEAVLEYSRSLAAGTLTVRNDSGSLVGQVRFDITTQTGSANPLDTLILGGSLFRAGGEECSGWVDSVEVISIECGP